MAGTTLSKAWALLSTHEKRNTYKILAVMIVGALASAVMVGSIVPFLTVLSDPSLIERNGLLSRLYELGGFSDDYDFLFLLGLSSIVVIVAANLILIFQTWVVTRFFQMRIHTLSRRLLSHYLAQPYEMFLSRHSGDMATNILSEAQFLVQQFLMPLANLISSLLTVLAVVASLIIVDPIVGVLSILAFTLIYIVVSLLTKRYIRRMGGVRAVANAQRYRIAGEALTGIKDIKLLGREGVYLDRFNRPSLETTESQIGVAVIGQVPRYAIQIVAFAGIIVLCLLLIDRDGLQDRQALGRILPVVGVLAFAGQRLMPELQKLYQSFTQINSAGPAVERIYTDLMRGTGARIDRSDPEPIGVRQQLEIERISYSYPNADRPGLDNVSLVVKAGERIGIVGSSGAGKTTLADVILGLLRPQTGLLRSDGIDITEQTLRAWQRSVAYVPQDIFLIDASLSENIALGLPRDKIDQAMVERAARIAQLHDFALTELAEGYDTIIGERGVRLSGGQRQRIGIARALYNDADLIVFDEATSALDNLTEREVMASIEALPGDKTIVMIAHRLSTVKVCDRIVLMHRGTVADVGQWDDLVARNPGFRALAEAA
ncbi:ABC-type bacteriocin/lantibiotic exporter, contains an N-terminal double-glycine peptidase domain [[Luteovulum] sphaeroides subsp. megalophilum]|uniref:ABC transporter ATP-binding protein n=1 Tax=Cereibacter sphaeroides TaxID=1063 RepID=UPI000B6C5F59|nr:ABC transporter ATP-binding protein [Cereibacter sphaeroides]SNT40055.1 ABC-type bacteriocin/lantibiotic exporter, contains an N-terminal double-glycine peptidase domain [[Luteovulum] sphaeroides subsp. megalophilum]